MSAFIGQIDAATRHIDAVRTHIDTAITRAATVDVAAPAGDVSDSVQEFFSHVRATRHELDAMSSAFVGAFDLMKPKPRFTTPTLHRNQQTVVDAAERVGGMVRGVEHQLIHTETITDWTIEAASTGLETVRAAVDVLDEAAQSMRNEAERGSKYILSEPATAADEAADVMPSTGNLLADLDATPIIRTQT